MSNELGKRLGQLHQRRRARETTEVLPKSIFDGSELNKLVYKEEIYVKHGLKLFPSGVGGKYEYPEGYSSYEYTEVDQLAQLARIIEESAIKFCSDVFVSLDNDSGYWPLKKEKIDKLIEWYLMYLEKGYQTISIFQSDYKKGIVIDNYCGYLPEHIRTNTNEIVYEYIRWEKI